ncbi:MAG: hypothetical protein E6I72_08615 [Chloroflexi bacterium]|nr:MAG: hypothetical protein E6I72_08615 [Chloroflexota bacterium]
MLKTAAWMTLVAAVVLVIAGCGYDTSATFNADGSVTVGLKFLFPKSVMQGTSGTSVSGLSASDIANANATLQKKYPGGKVTVVTEGDETGALITVPFKTEKDAFAFMTQPSTLNPSKATSGSGVGLNLSNTGGLFTSAKHTTSGSNDTYTFKTAAQPQASPSPGTQQVITDDEVASIFSITFALTVPHVITSAPGALFTLDRKTAIWKLHWTRSETLTATTGSDAGLVANVTPLQDSRLLVAVGFFAIAAGFLLGMFLTWRGLLARRQPAAAMASQPAPFAQPPGPPPGTETPAAWPGPPPEAPPPTEV